MTSKRWIEKTGAIGITSKAGRYGGTYAHKDIAFEFASWVSVEFKLYLIKEFQRLKYDENRRLSLEWNLHRTLSKLNYRIHTDAIKAQLIPAVVTSAQITITYATEADIPNIEGMNAEFIYMGLSQSDRLKRLNEIAIRQMMTLTAGSTKTLGSGEKGTS